MFECALVVVNHTLARGFLRKELGTELWRYSGTLVSQCEHRWELFKLHSDESVFKTVDHITGQFGVMNKKHFDELQQSLGWNHAPYGIMSDRALRCSFGPASVVQFDWLHVILQGTYPLEIELAMKSLGGLGFSPAKIYEFLNFDRLINRRSVLVIICQFSCCFLFLWLM